MTAFALPNFALIEYLALTVLVLLALWRGAGPERYVAGVFLGMALLDRLYHLAAGGSVRFASMDPGHLGIDLLALAAFVAIALKAVRFYPLFLAAFQLLAVTSHIVRAINPAINQLAYGILVMAPSNLQTAAFALGMGYHMLIRRRKGDSSAWLTASAHRSPPGSVQRRGKPLPGK